LAAIQNGIVINPIDNLEETGRIADENLRGLSRISRYHAKIEQLDLDSVDVLVGLCVVKQLRYCFFNHAPLISL